MVSQYHHADFHEYSARRRRRRHVVRPRSLPSGRETGMDGGAGGGGGTEPQIVCAVFKTERPRGQEGRLVGRGDMARSRVSHLTGILLSALLRPAPLGLSPSVCRTAHDLWMQVARRKFCERRIESVVPPLAPLLIPSPPPPLLGA